MAVTEKLQVVLELVSGQYKREAKAAATATGQVAAAAQKAGSASGNAIKNVDSFGGALKQMGVYAAAIKGISTVKAFVDDSINAFSELEQATGAVEAIFGATSKTIDKWAQSAARSFGLSEQQAKQSAAVIGAFLQNYGFSVDEAAKKSMELTELGADLAAMFGGTVPDAVAAISAALRGEFNPIERYGVSLRVATIEAHALEMGLAKTKSELDQNTKMTAALDLITQQTAKAQGQFARELDTVAGKEAVLNAERANSQALLGEALVGVRNVTHSLQSGLNKQLTNAALSFGHLTGEIDAGRAALIAFENETGTSADSIGDAVQGVTTLWNDWTYEIKVWQDNLFGGTNKVDDLVAATRELFASTDQSKEAFNRLNAELVVAKNQGEITKEEFLAMRDALAEEMTQLKFNTQAHNDNENARWRVVTATEEVGDAAEETGEKTKTAAERVRDLNDAYMEAADPLFAAQQALGRYETALENLAEVQKDGKSTSEDIAEAQLDVAEAAIEAQTRLGALDSSDVLQGLSLIADALGISHQEAADLLAVLGVLDGKEVTMLFHTRYTSAGTPPPEGKGGTLLGPIGFNHGGGRVKRGEPYMVGTHRNEELFIPDQSGSIMSNSMLRQLSGKTAPAGQTSGSQTVINVANVYGWDDFVAKVNKAGVDIRRLGLS